MVESELVVVRLPPAIPVNLNSKDLTFVIEHIRSEVEPVVFYFTFKGYNRRDILIYEKKSMLKHVITTNYDSIVESFSVDKENSKVDNEVNFNDIATFTIELCFVGMNSINPVYLNHLMLTDEQFIEYHEPDEVIKEVSVGFNKLRYVNLYKNSEDFLQVIRPYGDDFTTRELKPGKQTVLVPHIDGESELDDSINCFYEFMLMNEESINIIK